MGRSSSSSIKTCTRFLRKHRKWPHSPYRAKWHHIFNYQQAMQRFKQQSSPQISSLLHSFTIYNSKPTPQAYHFLIKTLSRAPHLLHHHIPPLLDHLEKLETFHTPESILAHLIQIYGNANQIEKAVDLFYRIPKFRCNPSAYSLNNLLSVLCRTREGLKMIPSILLRSREMHIRVEESTFRLLIAALCRIKKVGFAVEVFNCMISDGGFDVVDDKICSLLLRSLCEQVDKCKADEVMGFFGGLRKLGFCPGMMDYSNVIRFLVRGGMGMDALDVLNQMKSDGIKPDIVCYTEVLNGVVAKGFYSKADELFDELLVFGLVPDVYTYNVYINSLCKQGNVEAGIKMVACMEELGCKPNLITYNVLLGLLCKSGELSRARELLREMSSKGIRSSTLTYKVMIDGLASNGKVIEACGVLEEGMEKGFFPPSLIFDEIICGLCQIGLRCKALKLLESMVCKNCTPSVRVWEAFLLGYRSDINFAQETFIGLVGRKTKSSTLPEP